MSNARDFASRIPVDGALSNRNLIINGAMQVAQRGTQTNQTVAYTACDRWQFLRGGASLVTTTQDTNVPPGGGFGSSLKVDVTTADTSLAATDYAMVRTRLEGQDLQQLLYGTSSAKEITLSFWVKSPKAGIHVVELRHRDPIGGVEYNNQQYTITTADTWQNVTVTFAGQTTDALDNDNQVSLEVVFWLMAGSNYSGGTFVSNTWTTSSSNRATGQVNVMDSTSNNFHLTGVQLEVGDTATPFEHRSYGDELARCQRYYYKRERTGSSDPYVGIGQAVSSAATYVFIQHPVQMRANPTFYKNGNMVLNNGTARTASSVSSSGIGLIDGVLNVNCGSGLSSNQAVRCYFQSNGHYYSMDAEL